ncbi:MAG: glycosyltransferase family 4 protein [Pirellulaceae bacterium]
MKQINLTTPINQLGYGTVGLNATLGLISLGYDVALWPIGSVICPPDKAAEIRAALDGTGRYNRSAPSIRICQQFDLAQHVGKGVHAAITYFERNKLLDNEINHLQNQDVVIASSVWMRDLLAQLIRGPKLAIARPGVDTAIFSPHLVRPAITTVGGRPLFEDARGMVGDAGRPFGAEPTVFLAVGKWEVRKGHDVLATIFERAFTPRDNFKLVLATANPFLSSEQHEEWARRFARMGNKVEILTNRLPDQPSLARLMARADCGVFLSRAEGWNLDAAEMLAMGKHIIITNYSAHTEFANRENSWLVDIDELEVANDGKWFQGFGEWARLGPRQLEQAIVSVRRVHELKQNGRLTTNQAGIDTMSKLTWRAFAESVVAAVEG